MTTYKRFCDSGRGAVLVDYIKNAPNGIHGVSEDDLDYTIASIRDGVTADVDEILSLLETEKKGIINNQKSQVLQIDNTYECINNGEKRIYTADFITWPLKQIFFSAYRLSKKPIVHHRSSTQIIGIEGDNSAVCIKFNHIQYQDGTNISIIFIADVLVFDGYRGQGIGSDIEEVIQIIADTNNCDCIVTYLSVDGGENMQDIMERSKIKHGYNLYNKSEQGIECMKPLSKKGDELIEKYSQGLGK